jgi:hypothetical protein
MGLKDIFSWWSRRADTETLEQEREAEFAPDTRLTATESFGDRKVDIGIHESRSGAEAEEASAGDLDDA